MLTEKDLNTKNEYDQLASFNPYYSQNRWKWFREAMDMLVGLDVCKILELGSYLYPVVPRAWTVDIKGTPKEFLDLDLMPWHFKDKQFDLVICLQTLEHLERRKMAFDEIRRISKSALISLPFEWNSPEDFLHHNIMKETIKDWTNGDIPVKELIGGDENKKQIILYYKFK